MKQEIYDTVKSHLLSQNEKSMLDDGSCAYRGDHSFKCAIGCLISDEFFDESFNTAKACHPDVVNALRYSGVDCDTAFLMDLQAIHDGSKPATWAARLATLAFYHGLTP